MKSIRSSQLAMTAVALGAAVVLSYTYLFRTSTVESPYAGVVQHLYKWGKPSRLKADTNHDGLIDFEARFTGESGEFNPHMVPEEFWEDSTFDGVFDRHVIMSGNSIGIVEFDRDGDGVFEEHISGQEARDFYANGEGRLPIRIEMVDR